MSPNNSNNQTTHYNVFVITTNNLKSTIGRHMTEKKLGFAT